jgi:predicted amidohydrolase YtcJ
MAAFRALRKAGKLTARAHFGPNVSSVEAKADVDKAVAGILALKRRYDTGRTVARPGLTVRNASELALDGVLQAPAHTARMLEPYFVNAGTPEQPSWVPGTDRGPEYYEPAVINRLVAALAKAGIEPQIHAIGDRSVRDALNAFAYARKQVRPRDFRGQISHAEVVHPDDDKRFKQLNVTPVMSFQWAKPAPDSIEAARDFMGPERFARMEPEGSLYKAGARIAYGSDWPVDPLDEWFALQVGITRRNRDDSGKYAGQRLGDEIGLPRKYALRAITMNSAYALHHDAKTGSLERGKLADLIVLDQNVLRVPVMKIADTKVLMTMVGGKRVYRAAGRR